MKKIGSRILWDFIKFKLFFALKKSAAARDTILKPVPLLSSLTQGEKPHMVGF